MDELEILASRSKLDSTIIQIEYKWNEGKTIDGSEDIPKAIKELVKTLYMQRQVYKYVDHLEEMLARSRRSHSMTSMKYSKAMLLNHKTIATVRDLEEKNAELIKGL